MRKRSETDQASITAEAVKNSFLKLNPKEVIIYVKDFGIGIPASDQEQIFNSFFRASNVDKIEGTGLGLSIVKDFVEIHKGKITFDSMKDNGTEFMIQLPRQ